MKDELRTDGNFFPNLVYFHHIIEAAKWIQWSKCDNLGLKCTRIFILPFISAFNIWDKYASVNHFSFLIATHSFTNSREIREGKNRKKKEHHIESHKSIIMVSRHHTMSTSVSSVIEFPIWSEFWPKINTVKTRAEAHLD